MDELESATRRLSYTVLVQGMLFLLFVFLYVIMLPWGKLGKSAEYYPIAALPKAPGARENEAANYNEMK